MLTSYGNRKNKKANEKIIWIAFLFYACRHNSKYIKDICDCYNRTEKVVDFRQRGDSLVKCEKMRVEIPGKYDKDSRAYRAIENGTIPARINALIRMEKPDDSLNTR